MSNKDVLQLLKAKINLAASLTGTQQFIPKEVYYNRVKGNVENVLEEFKETGYVSEYEVEIVEDDGRMNVKATTTLNNDLGEVTFSY